MKQTLISNEINVEFNYAKINKDYCYFKIDTSDKYIKGGASFLDITELPYVKSVVFEIGKSFYIMTSSDEIHRSGLTKALNNYDGGDSLSVSKLTAEKIDSHILLQLFLNSLANSDDDICSYNNISGKLLCYKPSWLDRDNDGVLWGLDCIEVRVSKEMRLFLSAHKMTSIKLRNKMKFEKRKFNEYPQYEFSYNNHTLRRVSKENINNKSNLIQKPIEGDRGNITFFDFKNYDTFSCTKIGIIYDIINLINNQFSNYLKISFFAYSIDESLAYTRKELEEYKDIVANQLITYGINVIDEVQSSSSELYLQDLCKKVKEVIPEVNCSIGKRLSKKKVNIRYIHDRNYYDSNDPHNDNLSEYVIQHITVEKFSNNSSAAIMNILKELVIKHDLKQRKISIINWSNYNYESDWIFGTVINKNYYFMTIHSDGSFDIQRMKRDLFNMTEYDSYMDYFNADDSYNSGVVGLIKDAKGNINLIKDTNLYTLPDFKSLGDILRNVSEQVMFNGHELTHLIKDTISGTDDNKVKEELTTLIQQLDDNTMYDKITIMGMLKGMKTKKILVKSIFENTGILLYAYLRGEDARKEYLTGTIDVNYIKTSDDLAKFCVGEIGAGMQYTLARASIIREVEAVENSQLIFKEILPLMNVEFVRYGMLTVIPFPFKYIREFAMNN